MKLLQLTHRLPWPPVDGGKKGTLGFVDGYRRHPLITGHTLLCMCPQEEADWAAEWQPEGVDLQVELMDARNRVPQVLANTLFSALPFNMAKYRRPGFARRVERALAERRPDVVHFDSLHTAGYAASVGRLAPQALRVLRCHNAEHVILERLAVSTAQPLKRALIGLQARRLKAYEAQMLDAFDLILAITEADAARFAAINPRSVERTIVVPAGVDLPAALPSAPGAGVGPLRLLHIAAMDWLPNQAGLRWLVDEVLPLLDAAGFDYHLDVIGKNMPDEFQRYSGPRVTVQGFVRDLGPCLERAELALVPLKVGGGMRVKILDFWAAGIPVVSTRVGAEGLSDGLPAAVELADEPQDFAQAIMRLGRSAPLRAALRESAFRKVAAYGWPALVDGLVQRYAAMARRSLGDHPAHAA
jgi:glycosyltransferase involved in cell wall biosynthesis